MLSPVHIRLALAILVTVVVVGLATVILRNGSQGSSPQKSAGQPLPHTIDIALRQARFNEIRGGRVVWELVAARVEYDKSGGTAHLSGGIRIEANRDETRGAVVATADSGDYFSVANRVHLHGMVHIVSGDGAAFDGDDLDYFAADSRFTTAGPVTCTQERLTLKAIGMEYLVKDGQARFLSVIDATISGISR